MIKMETLLKSIVITIEINRLRMRKLFFTIFSLIVFVNANAQVSNLTNAQKNLKIYNLYQQGLAYKNGINVDIDYQKAFNFFSQGADLGDAQCKYAVAYMLFKGLGCSQNYDLAAQIFASGAKAGRDNSSYFYGLCLRNGYGVQKNEDSARYYLQYAANLGYAQAIEELKMLAGENSNDSATALVNTINNLAIPETYSLNHFTKMPPSQPLSKILNGNYKGWLIQYDWSGMHVVNCNKLQVGISLNDTKVTGNWTEPSGDTVAINGHVEGDSIVFSDMLTKRKDHYSLNKPITYKYKDARLNVVQSVDSVYVSGSIGMFSDERNEPSKPMYIALSRELEKVLDTAMKVENIYLKSYPNPFINDLTIEFELPKTESVLVQLVTTDGFVVYNNYGGLLSAGHYKLPMQISSLVSGLYMLKVIHDNQITIIKVFSK